MKYIVSIILVILTGVSLAGQDQRAYDIMKKVDERYDGDSITSLQTLILVNSKNQKKTRQLKSFSKEYGDDTRSIIYMLKPAEVRNTAFLSHNWSDSSKDDESWMYLPALDRVDRLPASDQKNAFMGSDFSFADMNGFELEEWQYRLIDENADINGQPCYRIEAVPAESFRQKIIDETGYDRVEHWITKDSYMTVQSHLYLADSSKNKVLNVEDIRDIEGILTPYRMTMKTYKGTRLEHASLLLLNEVVYNTLEDDNLFTSGQLRHPPM
ncbi:outer membrane lipoprotein-sorting protein [Gynuella sunshinyii]|uniref:Uncharacterized protein TP-0789 domain-containing protein n=1 Tax=Gynuella sunshinyii YC6258 TaxID=1445510 RepID=A0A0C5VCJ9_9GAMM|nr:outer membrane lipoprotein-sorting protein [Gynuella sunshinyii]AJQ97060.1 hypothetical Protein YC6258_05028 [Gynuella sunshinyii YC6258]